MLLLSTQLVTETRSCSPPRALPCDNQALPKELNEPCEYAEYAVMYGVQSWRRGLAKPHVGVGSVGAIDRHGMRLLARCPLPLVAALDLPWECPLPLGAALDLPSGCPLQLGAACYHHEPDLTKCIQAVILPSSSDFFALRSMS